MVGTLLQLPLDRSGFSLRRCPRCDAEFKVRSTHRDGRVLASALAERVQHLNGAEVTGAPVARHCPYCGATAPAERWWTREQRRWFDGRARSLVEEIRWRWMRLPFDRLGENPRPTYVTIPPNLACAPTPEEAEGDLIAVPLPCCGEEIKVSSGWIAPVRCHFCGLVHARTAVRDAWLELAQLRGPASSR